MTKFYRAIIPITSWVAVNIEDSQNLSEEELRQLAIDMYEEGDYSFGDSTNFDSSGEILVFEQ